MKVLLSAFDPFGGEKINPSLEVVQGVRSQIGAIEVRKIEIPTIFVKSYEVLLEEAKKYQPDVILSIGQAGGRYDLTLERVAININDARIPDNAGNQPIDIPIFEDGENAYFTNLPIKVMRDAMKAQNIPASISNTAGTFVCNHIMYAMLYHIQKFQIAQKGGFIHIPYLPDQVIDKSNTPYMEKERAILGIEIAIQTLSLYSEDVKSVGGSEF